MNIRNIFADSVPPVSGGIPYLSDDDSDIYLFHIGMPNPNTFPGKLMKETLMSDHFRWDEGMQYSPVAGDLKCRDGIVKLYQHRGEKATVEEIMITAGIAESFDLLPELFINPGDVIFTEDPSYPWGIRSFKIHRAEVRAIPTGKEGMNLNILEDEIKKAGSRAKLIYTMPVFHNPMGIVIPTDKRRKVCQLAEKYNLVVVEDDPYRELSFHGPAPTSMRQEFPDRVINLGTFSKTIGGGIRLGWIWASKDLILQLTQIKHTGTTTFTARATGDILHKTDFFQHLDNCRNEYRKRRDVCRLSLTENELESWIKYETPGGFYYWLTLPEHIDPDKFYKKAFSAGLYVLSGRHFSENSQLDSMFRLSFSFEKEEKMITGIQKIGQLSKSTEIRK